MSEWDRKPSGGERGGPAGGEADAESDHQLRSLHSNSHTARAIYKRIKMKRKAARESREAAADVPSDGPSLPQTGGAALDSSVQQRLSPHVGGDLSALRIHTGPASAHGADAIGARAFADGPNVHFNHGEFAPGTKEGDRLLAHEATHVTQQHAGIHLSPKPGSADAAADAHDPAEQYADAVGDQAAEALHGKPDGAAQGVDISKLSKAAKILEAMKRARPFVGPEAAAKMEALVTPQALEMLAAVMVGGAVLQAIPVVGEVADAGLAAWAIYSLGNEALHAGKEIFAFAKGALAASSPSQLDEAGHHFANFVAIVGVDGAIAFLLHKTSKALSKEVNNAAENISANGPGGPSGMAPAFAGGPSAAPAMAAAYRVLADGTIVRLSGAATGTAMAMSSNGGGGDRSDATPSEKPPRSNDDSPHEQRGIAKSSDRAGENRERAGDTDAAKGAAKHGHDDPRIWVKEADLKASDRLTSKEWLFSVEAPLPNGRTDTIAYGSVELDAQKLPLGGPEFVFDKRSTVGGTSYRISIGDEAAGESASLTKVALDRAIALFKARFGHEPTELPGYLAYDNKLNFQREYLKAIDRGIPPKQAEIDAAKSISFGSARIARGYSDVSVDASGEDTIMYGIPPKPRTVPSSIRIVAKRR